MKAVAYSIKPFEKEYLAIANKKKHDITLISNALSLDTAFYAAGKEAVIVIKNDDLSAQVIDKLAALGIKYIVSRTNGTDQVDKPAVARYGIKWSNVRVALSYEEQAYDAFKEFLPERLIYDENMMAPPPKVYLSKETLQEIADQTIRILDVYAD